MNKKAPQTPGDSIEEIAALIETLHQTGQRLEQLTGGEVDSVANRAGQTFLLQHAQDQLRLNEAARQAAILNALPASIALLDSQGIILSVNDAWQQFGHANAAHNPGHDVGVNYLTVCDDADEASQAAAGIRAVINGKARTYALEYPCHSPTEQRWLLMTVTLLTSQTAFGVVVMHLNITASKLAENALLESEEEFRTLAEAMPQIVWIARTDGRIIYFNQHWMDYTGLSLAESIGHGWNIPFHPDDQPAAWDGWQNATATHCIYSSESRLRRADGVYRWWLVRGVPLLGADGNILKWFGTCTDIHDLKMAGLEIVRANGELRESERRFSDLLGNVELVSMMLDREARITYCNDYLLHLTGWKYEEVIGKSWREIFMPPELNPLKDDLFVRLLDGQPEARHHENDIVTRSGERRLIRWNNSALHSGAGEVIGTASIGEDITERRSAEAKVAYLTRVYAMLSAVNTLIVRVTDRGELYKEACAIAVEAGGFRMSLIAMVDQSTGSIVPVASSGKDAALQVEITELLSSPARAKSTMLAKAIMDKEITVANDSMNDSRLAFGGKYTEFKVRSIAIFPLIVSDVAVGALALYASEIEFFQEEELKLLSELAGDIAFAIDHIDKHERLNYLPYYDVLTGLPNRTLLLDRLEQGLLAARRNDWLLAVMSIDLDNFKVVNDTLGHTVGDVLLQEVASRMLSCVRDTDTVGRLGGDVFCILLPKIGSSEDAAMLAGKLIAHCAQPHLIDGHELVVSGSIGITLFPNDAEGSEILLRNADTAMYRAKELGRNTYQFFTAEMNRNTQSKMKLEGDLRHALARGEFLLHYQPKVSCSTGKITGFEALLRWQHPQRGLVGPMEFIPILEATGLIVPVGEWVLNTACLQARRWRDEGLGAHSMAVNISGRQIHLANLCETVRMALASSGLAPSCLELELTESQLMKDAESIIDLLGRLKAMGVKLSVDDFGTGYSSLAYLKRFPIDCLKVDQAFVRDIIADPNDVSITRAIITLAHSLKLKVVAEGVETEGQLGLLIANHCDEVQGYYFSRPLPADEATALLKTGRSLDNQLITGMKRSRTLLLVDDEANILSSLKRLLRQDGYNILTALGAKQGMELLAIHPVDVVVSDQRMPGMSGIEFLRRIKTLHPQTVRLVLSGYTDLQAVTDAINEGAIYKFLTKPWNDANLRANIKEAFVKKGIDDENRRAASPPLHS